MRGYTSYFKSGILALLLVMGAGQYIFAQSALSEAEMVASWNRIILETAVEEDGLLTLKGVRTVAMAHLAMNDALNAIRPKYTQYAYNGRSSDAHPLTSAAQAAFEVAADQYSVQCKKFLSELDKWLAIVDGSVSKQTGIILGRETARSVLEVRSADGWNSKAEYTWHPMAPGVYAEFNEHSNTPEGFVFGAGWAKAKLFMIPSPSYFRAPPPPEIKSDEYTKDFNEVKEYGVNESRVRTTDQEHLAMWAKDFIENSHNRLARKLIVKERLDLWQAARLLALMNMAIFDAYVSVFDNKFYYNHWRPYTAIRWAAHDGNPDTVPDTTWNNLHRHTYAFPSYPSAHGAASGAAMTVLARTLGKGDRYKFTMTISEVDKAGPFSGKIKMDPPVRTFSSFSEAGMAFALSRIYLGIHFRYDSVEGYELGKKTGEYAVRHYMVPVSKPGYGN